MPCSESRVELWIGYNSYLLEGVCIFHSNIISYFIKVKNKIALPFHVIMTIINTRFSIVKNAIGLLSLHYK